MFTIVIVILVLFAALMLWAIYSDVTRYTLSNRLCLATACLYPVYLLALYAGDFDLPLRDIFISLGIAVIIFTVCAGFFALNIMGGGDVKLIPIVSIWAGTAHILHFLLITSLVGGICAAVIIIKNRLKTSKYLKSSENINLSVAKEEVAVPYGVGIAIGGLYVAFQLYTTFDHNII